MLLYEKYSLESPLISLNFIFMSKRLYALEDLNIQVGSVFYFPEKNLYCFLEEQEMKYHSEKTIYIGDWVYMCKLLDVCEINLCGKMSFWDFVFVLWKNSMERKA